MHAGLVRLAASRGGGRSQPVRTHQSWHQDTPVSDRDGLTRAGTRRPGADGPFGGAASRSTSTAPPPRWVRSG